MEPENLEIEGNTEEEPCEKGVYWTPELNIEFIRLRKSLSESSKFARGKRKGSLNREGWRQLIEKMGLQDKLTIHQGMQRWQNFVNKYKYEKDPTRIGKPADTPITWPLFHMMDWAVGDRLEKKSFTNKTQNNEVPDAVSNIPEMEVSTSVNDDQPSSDQTLQQDLTLTPPSDDRGTSVGAIRVTSRPAPFVSSRHQRTARLMQTDSAHVENELNSIRASLNDLAELQREKCESMRKNAEENMKTVNSIEKLVDSSGRQARALERFAEVLDKIVQYDNTTCTLVLPN